MVVKGHEESTKVLVWLSGLMGAGIFSVQGLLASAPLSIRLMAFVPWTLGILLAMVTRFMSGELQMRNDQQHFSRVSMLDLLCLETDSELVARNLRPILAGESGSESERRALNTWLWTTRLAYNVVHGLFALGVVAAVIAMILGERYR
jgi:hypothetical protein